MPNNVPHTPRLTAAQRATLGGGGNSAPHLGQGSPVSAEAASLVEARLLRAPRQVALDLAAALDVLGNRVFGFVVCRRATPFRLLGTAERAAAFRAWGVSPVPVARTVHQALRKLILSVWYSTPTARADIGVRPPLHTRAPAVTWEGPLAGDHTLDDEPVARQSAGATAVPGATPAPRPVPGAVIDGDALSGEVRLSADVVVIGSGAGGAVAAARLAEAGRAVVIWKKASTCTPPTSTKTKAAGSPALCGRAMRSTVDASISLLQGGAVGAGPP